jgi:CheY-like chemotaxis protein
MCNEEIERMKSVGYDTFNEAEPRGLADPRDALRTLTGFKVLRAYADRVPVIVTSFYPNPLIAQHCLVNGAFAYVRKPVFSKADNRHDFFHAAETGTTVQDLAAKTNKNPLDVVVVHFLTDAVSEVLKAMSARWISGLC